MARGGNPCPSLAGDLGSIVARLDIHGWWKGGQKSSLKRVGMV